MFTLHKSELAQEGSLIAGETTLHGIFKGIKPGADAHFVTIQGDSMKCVLTAEIAKTATHAQSINAVVVLEGVALWDTQTFEMVSFSPSSARCIQQELCDTFKDLSESYGRYFDAIDDVDAFVQLSRK